LLFLIYLNKIKIATLRIKESPFCRKLDKLARNFATLTLTPVRSGPVLGHRLPVQQPDLRLPQPGRRHRLPGTLETKVSKAWFTRTSKNGSGFLLPGKKENSKLFVCFSKKLFCFLMFV
jgi:hypothetical protein